MPDQPDELSSDAEVLTACRGPLVIGHRGAGEGYPENTLLSFQRAVEVGVNAIEFDVRCSRDGEPVVIHDATLDRTTDGRGYVADTMVRDLQRLDAGDGERIPTLAEVLEALPGVPLLIEVKEPGASQPIVDVLARGAAAHRVVVASFHHAALRPVRRASVHTMASRRETALWWSMSRIGLSPPRVAHSAFSVPEWSGRLHVVDRLFLRQARNRNVPVHVWTVDVAEEALRLWMAGVSGIITNRPLELVSALARTKRERVAHRQKPET